MIRRRLEKENKLRSAFRDIERCDPKRSKVAQAFSPLSLCVIFVLAIMSITMISMLTTTADDEFTGPVTALPVVKHNITNDGSDHPAVLVTGASNNHFDALFYVFLPSIFANTTSVVEDRKLIVIFYDLGLKKEQDALLRQTFPQVIYRHFRNDKYPALREAVDEFAWKLNSWKPIIMNQVANEFRQRFLMREQVAADTARQDHTTTGIVTTTTTTTTTGERQLDTSRQPAYLFWMDAGCLFPTTDDHFNQLVDYVHEKSLWSPTSGGSVHDEVHHDMVSYMGLDMNTVGDWQVSGGLVGMNIMDDRLVDDILIPWMACALVRDCIAPEGTEIKSHRQDQAALTLLMHMHGYEITPEWFDVGHHQEDTPDVHEAKRIYREAHLDGEYWKVHLD